MNKKFWTTAEIKQLENGNLPAGHTYHAAQMFCLRHGLKFPGKRAQITDFYKLKCKKCGKICGNSKEWNTKFICDTCKASSPAGLLLP